jgi:hypothetical protein
MKKFLEKTIMFQERSGEHANISNQYLEIYLTVKKLKSLPGSCTKSTTNVLGGNFGAPGYK